MRSHHREYIDLTHRSSTVTLCGKNLMFDKLAQIEKSYEELTTQISSPEFMSDMSAYARLMKQHRSASARSSKNIARFARCRRTCKGAKDLADLADDDEMREMADA